MHRDIRPDNILVDAEGKLKVIDFGFGKDLTQQANSSGKSIYLNWWCQIPEDFGNGVYDATTEVYFVGMLFKKIIRDGKLTDSRHMDVIKKMSQFERSDRLSSFAKVAAEIISTPERSIEFTQHERSIYQDFSSSLDKLTASISEGANYESDPDKILEGLKKLYEKTMLEPHIPEPSHLVRIFVLGTYRYYPSEEFSTALLKSFTDIFSSASGQKRSILLTNIRSKLDSIRRTPMDLDEEIPF